MSIGWYPGHMNKARKDIIKAVRQVDAVIEILDARIPYSSANPLLNSIIGDVGRLRVLNKSDLADPACTRQWLDFLGSEAGTEAISVDKTQTSLIRGLAQRCYQSFRRSDRKRFSILIVGIPNVGKSTLLNTLLNRKIAKVGNEPAVTKARQEVKLSEQISVIDTPGILWPKIDDINSGYRLAATGAIKNTAFEFEDVGQWTVSFMAERYPQALSERYGLSIPAEELAALDAETLLAAIGERRGCLTRAGVDFTKAAEILLNDLRTGKLGRLSLELPDDIPPPVESDTAPSPGEGNAHE